MRAAVALRVLARAVGAFQDGRGPLDEEALAAELGVPAAAVEEVLEALEGAGVVAQAGSQEEGRWLLARDPGGVRVAEVLEILAGIGEPRDLAAVTGADRVADRLLAALVEERRGSAHNLSLRELAERAAALERGEEPSGLPRTSPQAT
jgi:DNA-binding IscR family transcriptional regulator